MAILYQAKVVNYKQIIEIADINLNLIQKIMSKIQVLLNWRVWNLLIAIGKGDYEILSEDIAPNIFEEIPFFIFVQSTNKGQLESLAARIRELIPIEYPKETVT